MGRLEPGITNGMVDNQRLTLEHTTVLDYRASGKWRPRDQQSGIEINGILKHRFEYSMGVVNGENKAIDDDSDEKDFYGRIAFKLGGLGFDGYRSGEPAASRQTNYWADNALTAGVYAYFGNDGRENISWINVTPLDSTAVTTQLDNNFTRYGFDLHLNRGRFDFYAGAIGGSDDNPSALLNGTDAQREITSSGLVWPNILSNLSVDAGYGSSGCGKLTAK